MATLYDDISLGYHACGGSKVGKLYSFKPTDGSGDFTVTRAGTTAFTRTSDGYWKPAAANEPRFTYTNGGRSLLVEGAATRLNPNPYSVDKASWIKLGVRVEGDPATAGSELITNAADREFSSDTGFWIKGTGCTINDGVCTLNNPSGLSSLTKSAFYTIGKLYLLELEIKSISGTLNVANLGSLHAFTTTGIKKVFGTSEYNGISIYSSTGSIVIIDNVSVKEVSGFDCPFVDANGINTKRGRKLVATANNGSVNLAAPVVVTAATSYVNSVYIKRLVGTGTIYLVDVNGTDRAVTITSEWTRVQYAAAAAGTTGQIGIKMATAGDEVMMCYMPIEAGTVATSPIGGTEGTTQTRNADAETVDVPVGVTQIILTDLNDVETVVTSFSSPYQIPVGTWKSIIMK